VTGDRGVHQVRWGSRDHFLVVRQDIAAPEWWSCADVVVTTESVEQVFRTLPRCVVVLRATGGRTWTAWSRDGRRFSLRHEGSGLRCAALAYVLLSRVTFGGTSVTAPSLARRSTALGSSTST
jgi:hypothetical protein